VDSPFINLVVRMTTVAVVPGLRMTPVPMTRVLILVLPDLDVTLIVCTTRTRPVRTTSDETTAVIRSAPVRSFLIAARIFDGARTPEATVNRC
jgi:hypothetical protein